MVYLGFYMDISKDAVVTGAPLIIPLLAERLIPMDPTRSLPFNQVSQSVGYFQVRRN